MTFENAYEKFFEELGSSRKMVLSTSLDSRVSSRMMSIIILDKILYFQTDITSRKYSQLKGNAYVALCTDNIQIEGRCRELGHPLKYPDFSDAYQKCFSNSYARYTGLKNERLFSITPVFIERWKYIDGEPFIEKFDVQNQRYRIALYISD